MGPLDLIYLIIDNLGRRKARVALTAVGVVIGTAAVVVLISFGIGLQQNATSQLGGISELTKIQVMPSYGESAGPGPVKVMANGMPVGSKLVTDDTLKELAALPHVVAVVPRDYNNAAGPMKYGRLEGYASYIGVGINDLGQLGFTAKEGSLVLEKGAVVIGYNIPRNFGDPRQRPGQEPPPPPELIGETIKMTLLKYTQEGVEVRKTVPMRVIGQIAETRGESDWTVYFTLEDVTAFNEWARGTRINRNKDGYTEALVRVDDVANVLDVADQIKALGYQYFTMQSFVQGINSFYIIMQVMFGGMGAIALLVAAIGIANTMTMAILERTREIGLMKAVGATNRDVLSVFLGEAAGIGFLGGLGGVTLGWSGGQLMNVVALAYLAGQAVQQGRPPPTVAVYTPAWLPISALIFATLVGLFSGFYPALRAANLIPVNALKYE
jgi:putative ABC transport system permease protein